MVGGIRSMGPCLVSSRGTEVLTSLASPLIYLPPSLPSSLISLSFFFTFTLISSLLCKPAKLVLACRLLPLLSFCLEHLGLKCFLGWFPSHNLSGSQVKCQLFTAAFVNAPSPCGCPCPSHCLVCHCVLCPYDHLK